MNKYIPKMYKKSILDIDYDKIKDNNIKCIIFDLDNTLLAINKDIPEQNICKKIDELKKDFIVIILSNNSNEKRLSCVANKLGVNYVKFALKPFKKGFKKVQKMFKLKKNEMCIIGDQIMTDILGGNKYKIYTILTDPLSNNELKITGINRFFEKKVLKKLEKKQLLKRGEYYG